VRGFNVIDFLQRFIRKGCPFYVLGTFVVYLLYELFINAWTLRTLRLLIPNKAKIILTLGYLLVSCYELFIHART
jgi:hypothetical protein